MNNTLDTLVRSVNDKEQEEEAEHLAVRQLLFKKKVAATEQQQKKKKRNEDPSDDSENASSDDDDDDDDKKNKKNLKKEEDARDRLRSKVKDQARRKLLDVTYRYMMQQSSRCGCNLGCPGWYFMASMILWAFLGMGQGFLLHAVAPRPSAMATVLSIIWFVVLGVLCISAGQWLGYLYEQATCKKAYSKFSSTRAFWFGAGRLDERAERILDEPEKQCARDTKRAVITRPMFGAPEAWLFDTWSGSYANAPSTEFNSLLANEDYNLSLTPAYLALSEAAQVRALCLRMLYLRLKEDAKSAMVRLF